MPKPIGVDLNVEVPKAAYIAKDGQEFTYFEVALVHNLGGQIRQLFKPTSNPADVAFATSLIQENWKEVRDLLNQTWIILEDHENNNRD